MAKPTTKFSSENATLANFLINLALNDAARAQFKEDPKGVIRQAGLGPAAARVVIESLSQSGSRLKAQRQLRELLEFNNQIMDPGPITRPKSPKKSGGVQKAAKKKR